MTPRFIVGTLGILWAFASAFACTKKAPACAPNQSVSCSCPGTSAPGAQLCLEDGSAFDKCVCNLGPTSGSGADPSTTTSGPQTSTMSGPPQGVGSGQGGCGMGGAGGNMKCACDVADCNKCMASMCAQAYCPSQLSACNANPECKAMQDCIAACKDMSCYGMCIQQHPKGQNEMFALFTCEVCTPGPCFGDCQGAQNCSGGPMSSAMATGSTGTK